MTSESKLWGAALQPIFKETTVSTNRNLSLLPANFPQTITAKVQEGEHLRQRQLWAPFVHAGKNYKLVLQYRWLTPAVGEEWEVFPEHSPNGHIVFCQLSRRLKTATGQHPFVERTARHVRNGWMVHIHQGSPLMEWGNLKGVKVEGETLSITLSREGRLFAFTCSIEEIDEWRQSRGQNDRFGFDCYKDNKKYQIFFSDDVR